MIEISPRGNGACPLCRKKDSCTILSSLKGVLTERFKNKKDSMFEMVVYACPEFKE